jgi:hypothetical protein
VALEGPVLPDTGSSAGPAQRIHRVVPAVLSAETLTDAGNALFGFRESIWPLSRNVAALRHRIRLEPLSPPTGIEDSGVRISFSDSDPVRAQRMVSELVSRAIEDDKAMELKRCHNTRDPDEACELMKDDLGRRLRVVDPPSMPEDPEYPFGALALAGCGIGLAAAAIVKARPWTDWKQVA